MKDDHGRELAITAIQPSTNQIEQCNPWCDGIGIMTSTEITQQMKSSKPFKLGFLLGRFQHVHVGHEYLINTASALCDKLIVLVGSAQVSGTVRNPFPIGRRLELLKRVFGNNKDVIIDTINDLTNENDHSTEWAMFLLNQLLKIADWNGIKTNPDVFIFGNDEERDSWFSSLNVDFSLVKISRGNVDISATKLREYIVNNDQYNWRKFVNPKLYGEFESLRSDLLKIHDEDREGEDDE